MDPDYSLFAEIVAAGSLSAAARRLRISPAMVSKRLARLEARLGVQLAHRTTRRLVTTAAGAQFHRDIITILADLRAAEARVSGIREPAGRLRISAPTSFGRLHVAPHLHDFMRAHPRVSLEINLSDTFADLPGERIDVAIRIAAGIPTGLTAHRLAANRRFLCAAPACLDRYGKPQTLAALADYPLLAATAQLPWRLEGPGGLRLFPGESAVTTNSSEVVRELALAGAGVALRSAWDVAEDLRSGRLRRILPDWEGATDVAIHAVHPRTGLVPAAVAAFIAHLRNCYSATPPWEAG